MGLVALLKSDRSRQSKEANERYLEILHDPETDDPKILAELKQLAEQLDKSVEDVQLDLSVVSRVRSLQGTINAGKGIEPKVQASAQAVHNSFEQTHLAIQELQAKHRKVVADDNRIGGVWAAATRAIAELGELKKQHPALLERVEEIDTSILS